MTQSFSVRTSAQLDALSREVIGAAIEVHTHLGPGLLEATYEQCLAFEFELRGIKYQQQMRLPVTYKGFKVEDAYRADLIVEDELVVEIKCVDGIDPVNVAQVLTYLKMGGARLGLILNFKCESMKQGVRRVVHGL